MTTRIWIILILYILTACSAGAQPVTFSADIAPPVFRSCTPCHRSGEIGPFTLENYQDIKHQAKMMKYVVSTHLMPPWGADNSYRSFHNERSIDTAFIRLLTAWIDEGYPEGKPGTVYKQTAQAQKEEKPDYIIRMHTPLRLDISADDLFMTYSDSLVFGEERYIRGIKIIPGNKRLVHHCRVDFDSTDRYARLMDSEGFLNTHVLEGLPIPTYQFVGDYVPGISSYHYPKGIGYKVSSKIYPLVNIHYSPNSRDDVDSTKVYLYMYPRGYKPRPVMHICLTSNIKGPYNRDLVVPHDSISDLVLIGEPLDSALSLICIQPHMHLIGRSMKIFAVPPHGDTIPLINVKDWDFNWQENYYYKNMVVLPRGTIIYAQAVYDNTIRNPKNPSVPPEDVYFNGDMKTTNEMFEYYLQAVRYRPGDETLNLYDDK